MVGDIFVYYNFFNTFRLFITIGVKILVFSYSLDFLMWLYITYADIYIIKPDRIAMLLIFKFEIEACFFLFNNTLEPKE